MTIVVTGPSGHIGGTLVRALLARGRPVRALVHRDRKALEGQDVEMVAGDVCDPASLRDAFAGAEVVYHAAGHISILENEWPRLYAVNVQGTRNVVRACLDSGVHRLVHFSSIHALEPKPLDVPIDESRPLVRSGHHSPYDYSKAAGEREVRKGIDQGLDAVILNPTGVIGPHDYRPSHIGEVLLALGRGRLPALVPGGFDWVDARDVALGAMLAEERAPAGAKYLLSGHWVSVRDLAAMVQEITEVRAPRSVFPMALARLAAPLAAVVFQLIGKRPVFTRAALNALRSNRSISHERASRDLGYHPRPFRDTLWDTFRWFEEAGYLARPLAVRSPEVA